MDILIDNGFVVREDLDEFKFYKLLGDMNRFNSKNFGLTIATTLDCNMACPYCYEEHKKIYMNEETADRLFEFTKIRVEHADIKHLYITWYGGEPLLNLDIIKYLSEKFIKFCKEKNITYEAYIITNGVLLDKPTAELLNECKVTGCQITIDGDKETNDVRRLLTDGSSSFDAISQNIDYAKDLLDIHIRCNIDKTNVNSIDFLTDYFKQKGVVMHVAPVDKSTDVCKVDKETCFTPYEFKDIEMYTVNKQYTENKDFISTKLPTIRTLGCGTLGNSSYVIDPEGNLLKCWNYVGDESKIIGNVATGELMNKENLKWLTFGINDKCSKCKLLPTCAGGCPDATMRDGEPKCSYRKYSLNDKIKLAYDKYIYDKEASVSV